MTERSLSELAGAEVVPNAGGPNAYMLRFGDNDYGMVNKSAKHVLIVENDVLPEGDTVNYGGIMVDFDLEADEITLHDGDNTVRVPDSKHEHVLWSVHDEDGPRLNKLFNELYVPTVRKGVMDWFMPRFREDQPEIKKTDDGWLLHGDILLAWDGTNSPVDVDTTHVVSGGEAVQANTEKEAREIQFPRNADLSGTSATTPDGRTITLDDTETRFLTTVALVLGKNPNNYDDDLFDVIEDSRVAGFTDTRSGLHHGHGMGKHTLDMLGVTDEASDRLWYNEYDHAGVHEMAVREEEFRDAPIDVFENASNDDSQKWRQINSTKEKAPIPKRVRADLRERYGE